MSAARNARIQRGEVQVLFAYDVGLSIDLPSTRQQITDMARLAQSDQLAEPAAIQHKGHAPRYFQFDPLPLRVTQKRGAIEIGGHATKAAVELVLYDFGGVSVSYDIPFQGTLEELLELSCELSASTALREDSLERVQQLISVIESSVRKSGIAPLVEDYLVFLVEELDTPCSPREFLEGQSALIARVLRSEKDALSDQEIAEAVGTCIAFGPGDLAVIDWNAALVLDRESEDVRAVLEFANLQLLELRYLDEALDQALDRSYDLIGSRGGLHRLRLPGVTRHELARVARLQVDSAILFERVNNALKLLGDQYLARVYRATAQRFRLNEWNTTLLRKLETTENIYEKVHDRSLDFRMEVLEWIIIFLIALELVLPFVMRGAGH